MSLKWATKARFKITLKLTTKKLIKKISSFLFLDLIPFNVIYQALLTKVSRLQSSFNETRCACQMFLDFIPLRL